MPSALCLIISCIVWSCTIVCAHGAGEGVVRLSSFPSYGKDSPFHLAQEAGFYEREGIKFQFQSTYAGALAPLVAGSAEIAHELCSEIVGAISRGAALKIIASREAKFPVATISLESSGIRSPADYAGKRWATSVAANPELSVMGELARLNQFRPETVRVVNIPFNARAAALIAGEADFASAWYGSGLVQLGSILAKAGARFSVTRWSDYGIHIHGQCLAARTEWLQSNGALVRSFLRATLHGFEEAIRNPNRAVEATIKQSPNAGLDMQIVQEQWSQARELLVDDYASEHGLLAVDPQKIARISSMISPTEAQDIRKFFTNEYLPTP